MTIIISVIFKRLSLVWPHQCGSLDDSCGSGFNPHSQRCSMSRIKGKEKCFFVNAFDWLFPFSNMQQRMPFRNFMWCLDEFTDKWRDSFRKQALVLYKKLDGLKWFERERTCFSDHIIFSGFFSPQINAPNYHKYSHLSWEDGKW